MIRDNIERKVNEGLVTQRQRRKLKDGMIDMTVGICCHHHHHHVVLVARVSLTLSRHFSLLFIASGRSSGQHPVSSHSICCTYHQPDECGTRPFLRWVQAQGHRPDTPSILKDASGPISIYLKRGISGIRW